MFSPFILVIPRCPEMNNLIFYFSALNLKKADIRTEYNQASGYSLHPELDDALFSELLTYSYPYLFTNMRSSRRSQIEAPRHTVGARHRTPSSIASVTS